MVVPTREDLNAALDAIDQLKGDRATAKGDAAAKAAAATAATAASDTAAATYLATGQALSDAVAAYSVMVQEYVADTANATARTRMQTAPTVRLAPPPISKR